MKYQVLKMRGIWERWWKSANDWLEEIDALDIDVKDSALQLVAITKIALGSSEGYSLAESLDKEDVDAVVRLWGYEPHDDKEFRKQHLSAHRQLKDFISNKLTQLHAAVEVLWSEVSTEVDIQRIEQHAQQIAALKHYNDQTINTMLLGSAESVKVQSQLCQVLDDGEKETVKGIIKDISTHTKNDK